jgi:hypothetical protein
MYMLGQDSRGRQLTGGESGKGLMLGGFAASGANALGDKVNSLGGGQIGDELSQVLAGAALSYAGRQTDMASVTNPMARGIHYNAAQQAFSSAGVGLGQFITGSGGSSAPSVSVDQTHNGQMARNDELVF